MTIYDVFKNPPAAFFRTQSNVTGTTNVAVGTDYEMPNSTLVEHRSEENHEKINDIIEEHHEEETQEEENEIVPVAPPSPRRSPVVETVQEEDILVEENVTPFYINSGENLEETLHRLGIDIPKHMINEQTF